ncbi:Pregnancy-Specific Beta-1-Glycoprotein 5 [Manis pentadactyla]|nr:Pregnancy-Specific Beta-1-Glycoprotein 5 [Manis pentadactyla]
MHMIRLRREFGSILMVWGGKGCFDLHPTLTEGEGQIDLHHCCGIGDIIAASEGTDAEVDYVSSGKVARAGYGIVFCEVYRKNRGDYTIQFQDYCEPRLISKVMTDVRAMARLSFTYTFRHDGRKADGVISGECAIQFQDYSEARVISM